MTNRAHLVQEVKELDKHLEELREAMVLITEQRLKLNQREESLMFKYSNQRDHRDHLQEQIEGIRSMNDPYIPF